MPKVALIDGDILVYRTGFGSRDVSSSLACSRMDKTIEAICRNTGTEDYKVYLTSQDHSNFRFEVDANYKATRKADKPPHYLVLREYLGKCHRADMAFGCEADDLLGINQTKDTIICSIDKDLRQVPGEHYNFVKDYRFRVTPTEGLYWFYTQMLTGDNADNIKGVARIGPVTAKLVLGSQYVINSKSSKRASKYYLDRIVPLYKKQYGVDFWEKICQNGALLKIKQEENEPIWHPRDYLSDRDLKRLSQIP